MQNAADRLGGQSVRDDVGGDLQAADQLVEREVAGLEHSG
jgi:hypothetical protein